MVNIDLTRTEALQLLVDLPDDHWIVNRVLKTMVNTTETENIGNGFGFKTLAEVHEERENGTAPDTREGKGEFIQIPLETASMPIVDTQADTEPVDDSSFPSSSNRGAFVKSDEEKRNDEMKKVKQRNEAVAQEEEKKEQCNWELYGYQCRNESKKDSSFCDEHDDKKCSKCGQKAVHGCPMELQFVCGEPLCAKCGHNTPRTESYYQSIYAPGTR